MPGLLLLAALTGLVCAWRWPIARSLRLFDEPTTPRKQHTAPVPRVGGIAILVPLAIGIGIATTAGAAPAWLVWVAGASLASGLIGFLDDRGHLQVGWRLTGIAVVLVLILVGGESLRLPELAFSWGLTLPLGWGATLFTAGCLIVLVSAMNMADGANGLVPGMWTIWGVALLVLAPTGETAWILALMLASLGVVLIFNWPGYVFLGDCGAYGGGVVVGLMAIAFYNASAVTLPADGVAAWFLVPVLDGTRVIATRWCGARSAAHADRDHLHHYLRDALGPRAGVLSYLGLIAVIAAIPVVQPGLAPLAVGIAVVGYAAAWLGSRAWLKARAAATPTKLREEEKGPL